MPMPLMRHSKSMATGLRTNTPTDAQRPGSTYSTQSTASVPRDVKVISNSLKHLNMPLSDANRASCSTDQLSVPSSNLSHRRAKEAHVCSPVKEVPEESLPSPTPRPNADELSKRRTGAMSSTMGSIVPSLIDSYRACRKSMVDSSVMDLEMVKLTAEVYESQFIAYLDSIDNLPQEVKECPEVISLREAALDTVDLFNKSLAKSEQELLLTMTDKVMGHAKQLMENIQRLILDFNKPLPTLPELDNEDGDDASIESTSTSTSTSSTSSEAVTVDMDDSLVDASVTIVGNEENYDGFAHQESNQPEHPERRGKRLQKVRRVKSSFLSLGPRTRTISTPTAPDDLSTIAPRTQNPTFDGPPVRSSASVTFDTESIQRPANKFTNFPCLTQVTLVDETGQYNQDLIDQNMHAFKQINISNRKLHYAKSIPDDSVDFTYAIDGNIKSMAQYCIIPHMIHQQMSTNIEDPGEGFIDVILTCFRYWISPENFAKSFVDAYECEKSDMMRLSLALVIRRWLKSFWLPDCREAIPILKKFVGRILCDELNSSIALDLLNRLQGLSALDDDTKTTASVIQFDEAEISTHCTSLRRPLAVRLQSSPTTPIYEIRSDVKLIAEQLTLLESEMYLDLKPHEVMHRFILRDQAGADIGKRMKAQANFSTQLMHWALYAVVSQHSPAKRAKMYSFLIKLSFVSNLHSFQGLSLNNWLQRCLRLQNYSSAHSIYNGLEKIHLGELPLTNKVSAWRIE